MITVRELKIDELDEAIDLRIQCWDEELAGRAENLLEHEKLRQKMNSWMDSAEANEDIRIWIGAFEDGKMLGAACASFADTYDIDENGVELNGLWVFPECRENGVASKLILYVLDYFEKLGKNKIVVYNHHFAPSNEFFRKLGMKVIRKDKQLNRKLTIDVFVADVDIFRNHIEKIMKNRKCKLSCML